MRLAALLTIPLAACLAPVASSIADSTGGAGDGTRASAPSTSGAPVHNAKLRHDGTVIAPSDAPGAVKRVIAAANRIARTPYRYGGGHGSFNDSAYDCSGSVSYALHGGNLVSSPMPSGGFQSYGSRGRGRWITTYANGGHMYVVIAGLRFDTSGARQTGSRWQRAKRSSGGFTVRHPRGF